MNFENFVEKRTEIARLVVALRERSSQSWVTNFSNLTHKDWYEFFSTIQDRLDFYTMRLPIFVRVLTKYTARRNWVKRYLPYIQQKEESLGLKATKSAWLQGQPTGLFVPPVAPQKQAQMFDQLVDILFNEKGKWSKDRINRAIKLIKDGARIGTRTEVFDIASNRGHEHYTVASWSMRNMMIWENAYDGHCIADLVDLRKPATYRWGKEDERERGPEPPKQKEFRIKMEEREENVFRLRQKLLLDGYRDGWRVPGGDAETNIPPVLDGEGKEIFPWRGPYCQLIPKNSPPYLAYFNFENAKEAKRQAEEDLENGPRCEEHDDHYMYVPEQLAQGHVPRRIDKPHAGCARLMRENERLEAAVEEAEINLGRAKQKVEKCIGWEMPGGDLMTMLVKKKIPLEIIRVMLDYGLRTRIMTRDWDPMEVGWDYGHGIGNYNDRNIAKLVGGMNWEHMRFGGAGQRAVYRNAAVNCMKKARWMVETFPRGACFFISTGMNTWARRRYVDSEDSDEGEERSTYQRNEHGEYRLLRKKEYEKPVYIEQGRHSAWSMRRWKQTGRLHFTITQYMNKDDTTPEDITYYQKLLLLIFTRHFRVVDPRAERPPGFDMLGPEITDTSDYHEYYGKYFPRLTGIALKAIKDAEEVKNSFEAARAAAEAARVEKTKKEAATKVQKIARGAKIRNIFERRKQERERIEAARVEEEAARGNNVMLDLPRGGRRRKTHRKTRRKKRRKKKRKTRK